MNTVTELAHEKYREQWRKYVIRMARPHSLTYECLSLYDQAVKDSNASWSTGDFAKAANEALWEWDI